MNPLQVTVDVARYPGFQQKIGYLTATSGLVVLPPTSQIDPGWSVHHQRSGLLVCYGDNPEHAQMLAAALGTLGVDWSATGQELRAELEFSDIKRTVQPLGGRLYGRPVGPIFEQAIVR